MNDEKEGLGLSEDAIRQGNSLGKPCSGAAPWRVLETGKSREGRLGLRGRRFLEM